MLSAKIFFSETNQRTGYIIVKAILMKTLSTTIHHSLKIAVI